MYRISLPEMITYSVVARDEETGEELSIPFTNLAIDSPLVAGVEAELRRQGYPERVITQFLPEPVPSELPTVSIGEGGLPFGDGQVLQGQLDDGKLDDGKLDDGKAPCPICGVRWSKKNMARHVSSHNPT